MIVLQRKGERERIELLLFAPDGRSLFASSYTGATLWCDLPNISPHPVFPEYRCIKRVRFTPDGKYLITDHKGLTICDLADGTERHLTLWNSYSSAFDVTPDGSRIVIVEANPKANWNSLPGWQG